MPRQAWKEWKDSQAGGCWNQPSQGQTWGRSRRSSNQWKKGESDWHEWPSVQDAEEDKAWSDCEDFVAPEDQEQEEEEFDQDEDQQEEEESVEPPVFGKSEVKGPDMQNWFAKRQGCAESS